MNKEGGKLMQHFSRKTCWKKPLARHRRRRKNDIKKDINDIGHENFDWVQDRVHY
jgi:hypothetical protein